MRRETLRAISARELLYVQTTEGKGTDGTKNDNVQEARD